MKKVNAKKPILSVKSACCYAFGIFGVQLLVGYMNGYQSQFYTSMFGANLMVVAVIILVSKLISSIADPFIGNLIDKCNFKSGKMRPFIVLTAFPFAIITTIMFIYVPFKNMAGMYVYITFLSVAWNIAMSFADIPSQGMLSLLSPNPNERNMAAGITNILKSISLSAPSVIVPLICIITKSGDHIGRLQYMIASIVISILGCSLFLVIYFGNKEAVPTTRTNISFKSLGKELIQNKMLMIVFLIFMLGFGRNMAMGIGVQAGAVLLREGVTIPIVGYVAGENLPWMLGLTSAISATFSIVVTPFINKKWGEKKTFIIFAIYGFVACLLSFSMYATGLSFFRSIWAILAFQFMIGFCFGTHGYLPMVMVSDIVDYQEWKTGKRTEGTQFAVLSMSIKISNALSVAVGIFIVGASGYNAMLVREGIISISNKMQTIVFAAYVMIPGICMLLSMIPMFWYKIDAKTKAEVLHDLEERRANVGGGEVVIEENVGAIE